MCARGGENQRGTLPCTVEEGSPYMADEAVAPKLLKRSELGRVLSNVIVMYTRTSLCLLLTCG